MSEIFISHAHSNASQAQAVAAALRALGYGVWLDEQLPAHRAYTDVIEEHLRAAKVVVVIWSVEAAKSQWVRSEANAGRELHKLVQLSVDGAKLPLPFDQIQCAKLAGWVGDLQAPDWKKVIASIFDLTGGPGVSMVPTAQPHLRKNSICVLPFVNMSRDAEQEYFSDGISEDIITDLSKVSALFVIARNTAFTFKAKSVDVPQVARQLNVSYLLEGSVRKAGGRVRITAQLIDGATGGHVWAERYDRDLTDIFALQDEIAEAIVKALKLKLLPEGKKTMRQRGTNNLEAYDLYLRGTRPAWGADDLLARTVLLEASVQLAPDYADAWGALAYKRALLRFERPYAERDEIANAVAVEAQRALALDPDNLAAFEAQYHLLPPFGRLPDAQVLLDRLETIAGGNSRVWRAGHLGTVGRIREAIDVAQHAYDLDPLEPVAANYRARTLLQAGRYAEARRGFEDALVRWPEMHYLAINLLLLCVHIQDWAAVDALLSPDRLKQFPSKEFERWAPRYASIMRDPSPASRRRPVEAVRRRFEASGTADFFALQLAAKVGVSDEAHAIALRARFGPGEGDGNIISYDAYRPGFLFSSMFPEFRRDPRFVKLCARVGLVTYWLTTQQWPDCVDEVAPYYDFKAECAKVAAGPPLPPANEFWSTPAA